MISLSNSNIRVLGSVEELDYFDTQTATLRREVSPLEAWNLMMLQPQPLLKVAFKLRDAISACFGVKKIGGFSGAQRESVSAGEYLEFFYVEYVDDTTLVLTERDRHLDVMTCISTAGQTVTVTSSVRIHNMFGRAYMLPVGIAHKWIVRGMLRRLQRTVTEDR